MTLQLEPAQSYQGGGAWDLLNETDLHYSYYLNGSKTYTVVKPDIADTAREIFHGREINILVEGRTYFGGVIDTTHFIQQFADKKVQEWLDEIRTLNEVARPQPHAAYAALTQQSTSTVLTC